MTIEEKLSAIKAINEEKDAIEIGVSALLKRTAEHSNDWRMYKVSVPHEVIMQMDQPIIDYFRKRRAELIAKAESIMKSEQCAGNCGMNYCDENGCVERKRELVNPIPQISSQ